MACLPKDPQSQSLLFRLPGEIRNMIYEYLDIVVYAKLKPTVHEDNSKDFVPHRIALCLRVPPSALMSTCQQLHQEISKFRPLLERLHREHPRILISYGCIQSITDYHLSHKHTRRDLAWCYGAMISAACTYVIDLLIADQDGEPKPFLRNSGAKFLGKDFEDEKHAALAALYTERLGHHFLWRYGDDMDKMAARDIGPEPLLHVTIKLFDTQGAEVRARSPQRMWALDNIGFIKTSDDGKVLKHRAAYELYHQGMLHFFNQEMQHKMKYGIATYLVYPDVRANEGIPDNSGTVDGLVSFQVTKEVLRNKRDVSIGKLSTVQQWQADWGDY